MNSEKIRSEIEELLLLVASWEQDSAPSVIEQDIALAKIAKLYEGVKFMTRQEAETPTESSTVEEVEAAESAPAAYQADDSIFAIDLDGISLIEPKAEVEAEAETESEPEEEPEPQAEEEKEEIIEEEKAEEQEEQEPEKEIEKEVEKEEKEEEKAEEKEADPTPPQRSDMLFDIAPIPKKNRSRRRVLMSLYHDDGQAIEEPSKKVAQSPEAQAPKQEPTVQLPLESPVAAVAAPTPIAEPTPKNEFASSSAVIGDSSAPVQTLADTLSRDVETLADRYAESSPKLVGESTIAYNSFDKLGINERYLLARDLFGDDPQLCVEELSTIGAFDNYDDAIIYIAENYNWSGESEGAKLLLSVLERKFNIS